MATAIKKKVVVPANKVKQAGVVKTVPKQVVKGITFKIDFDEDDDRLEAGIYEGGSHLGTLHLNVNCMKCSCGARDVDGAQDIQTLLNKLKSRKDQREIVTNVVVASIKKIKEEDSAAFIVMSNNTKTPEANEILDHLCISCTNYCKNPNSGSTIRMWIL